MNKRIELNRAASINNFERIFDVLEDRAWGIVVQDTKKEMKESFEGFERTNDIAKENVLEIINHLFDLEQAIDAMPKEVQDAVWKKRWEVQTEREAIEEDNDDLDEE